MAQTKGKKMKSLEEFNKDRMEAIERHSITFDSPRPNGIACPLCGNELVDSFPESTLMSNPPKKNIACIVIGCGFKGYRIA